MALKRIIKRLGSRPPIYLFISFLLIIPSIAHASPGRVTEMSGAAYYRAKDSIVWAAVSKDMDLNIGDRIRTGPDGRVALKFQDGSRLNMGNSSEMELTEFLVRKDSRSAAFTLSSGKIRAFVSRFSGNSDFRIKTPTGVAGVKGTDFIMMSHGPANVIFGNSGKVDVSGGNEKAVALTKGRMTENTGGVSPIEPIKVEPGTPLAGVRAELESITDVKTPVDWEKAGRLPSILAKWNINYGHYLADSKRYNEALDVFQIAIDLTEAGPVKAEGHLEKGTVLARGLNNPKGAIFEYTTVIEKYPEEPFLENAVFSAALADMDIGDKENALSLFERYMRDYPEGRHIKTVEFFINTLEKD